MKPRHGINLIMLHEVPYHMFITYTVKTRKIAVTSSAYPVSILKQLANRSHVNFRLGDCITLALQ